MGTPAAPAIPYLIPLLNDSRRVLVLTSGPLAGEQEIGTLAMQALAAIGKPATDALIIVATKPIDPKSDVTGLYEIRCKAIKALGSIKDASAVEPLISLLTDQDAQCGDEVVIALRKIKDVRAVEPLIKALGYKNYFRAQVAGTLGDIKDPRAVKPLITLLASQDGQVAARALANIGKPALDALLVALKAQPPSVRRWAASALGKIKDPSAVDPLITLLSDQDKTVLYSAAIALGEIKDPRATEPLFTLLLKNQSSWDWPYKSTVIEALKKIKDPRAIDPLITALSQESDWMTCDSISEALSNFNDTRAIEPIITSMEKTPQYGTGLRYTKRQEVLNELTGVGFDTVKEWRQWWESNKGKFKKD